jgi:AcrR family transcriptional regulator
MPPAAARARSRGGRVPRGAVRTPALGLAAGNGRVRVADMQRSRLLGGAVAAVEELGWSRVTTASIVSRARVSRRTFYDLFSDREDCLLEVLQNTTGRIASELDTASLDGLSWRERVRTGLWIVLSFFDREPELARLCVVGSARGGRRVLEWREEVLARLTVIMDEGQLEGERAARVPSLTAEGSVGAVLVILSRRLLKSQREPLSDLVGDLMGMIVLPYLGPAAARSERTRPAPTPPLAAASMTGPLTSSVPRAYRAGEDPLRDVPMRLTYRTALVLEGVAQNPGASNRVIGERAEVYDQGQISKLLGRLERLGLLANTGEGHSKGEPNAWRLTEVGERVVQHLALSTDLSQEHDA